MRINDELVTWYSSSQTCPYTLAQQPMFLKMFDRAWGPLGIQRGLKTDIHITLRNPYKLIGFLLSTSNVGN
jgi:hypothetical protein